MKRFFPFLTFVLVVILILWSGSPAYGQDTRPTFGPTCAPQPTFGPTCPPGQVTPTLPVTAGSSATNFILFGGLILLVLGLGTSLLFNPTSSRH